MAEENRLRSFKNKGKDTDEMRRRRIGQAVELRKAKKDDQLLKRRNIASLQDDPTSPVNEESVLAAKMQPHKIIQGMMNPDETVQYQAMKACREILSQQRNPPIDKMICIGVVPRCVEFLGKHHFPELQFEACWALTNIASGTSEQTATIVQEQAIPKLIDLLASPNKNLCEQAVWALGNIAGDGPVTRDLLLNMDVLSKIIDLIRPGSQLSLIRNAIWTISNLCRNKKPYPDFEMVKPVLPVLAKLLLVDDQSVLVDTCWALSYLTDGSDEKIQVVIDSGVVNRLVQLLHSDDHLIIAPALRSTGNIVTGNDAQTECVINAGVLDVLPSLLRHTRLNIVKEAAWAVSNITAGNSDQIQAVIDAGILSPLLTVITSGDFRSQKEAAWAVTNFTVGATVAQMATLVEAGFLQPLCNILSSKDAKIVVVVLDGITNILRAAAQLGATEKLTLIIEECGGLDLIESLQQHDNDTIYEKAVKLIENYFSEENPEKANENATNDELRFMSPGSNGLFHF